VRDFYFPEAAQPTYPFTVLAECTYDYKNGEWTYLRLRGDKTLPTYYAQAFNQLEATAERLTKEVVILLICVHAVGSTNLLLGSAEGPRHSQSASSSL